MKLQITKTSALASLRKAVAGKGEDFVYEPVDPLVGCLYFDALGMCSCIVGHVLADHGYTLDDIEKDRNNTLIWSLDHRIDMTAAAKSVLSVAQRAQDHGRTWGVALMRAEEEAEEWDEE